MQTAQALTIAGSDSGGGAGIQADLKTFQMLGVFGTSVITNVTAQNTQGVFDMYPIAPSTIASQLTAVIDDFCLGATKIGMLGDEQTILTVRSFLQKHKKACGVVILDPVMIAKGGAKLLQDNAIACLKTLLPWVDIITPNLPEAMALTQINIQNDEDIMRAMQALQDLGAKDMIIKGGHRADAICRDWACLDGEIFYLDSPKIPAKNTHGTGCTFSACLAAHISLGKDKKTAFALAKDNITQAIQNPIDAGKGIGAVNHWAFFAHSITKGKPYALSS